MGRSVALAVLGATLMSAIPVPVVGAEAIPGPGSYTIDQAISDKAQLNTIAFDGLGFLTGSLGSDSFFPPGKVADFWGFQYLRDNDPTGMGHNTDFLTRVSLYMLDVLTPAQRSSLAALADRQVGTIDAFAMERFVFMSAARRLLTRRTPTGTTGLNLASVRRWSAGLYRIDGGMSIERARVMGAVLRDLTDAQRARLEAVMSQGVATWPVVPEPSDMRGLDQSKKVAIMTYAGDMASWYLGSVVADVYFCPERHGTYFGSFYLKDAPAVGNPGYSIDTSITGELGSAFLSALSAEHARVIRSLVTDQRGALNDIVNVRRLVSIELRKALSGGVVSNSAVATLMARYGADDGRISYLYASAFATINRSLSAAERTRLRALRSRLIGSMAPDGAFRYATSIPIPTVRSTDFLFRAPV